MRTSSHTRHAHFPDAGERRAAPAAVPAPESWQFQDFRTEVFYTGRTGAYAPSLTQKHLSGTSVTMNPVYGRKPGNCLLSSAVTPAGAARLSPSVSGSIRKSFLSSRTYSDRQETVQGRVSGLISEKNMCNPGLSCCFYKQHRKS